MPSDAAPGKDAPGTAPPEDADPRGAATERLHPASWFFVTLHTLRQALFALIGAFVVGAGRDGGLWFPLAIIVPATIAALWYQWIYRYGFSERGLVVHEGLFFRTHRTIDYARIENVDTERGLLHRLLDVAEVRVETSTGGKPEAHIRVLALKDVQAMRERIFARREARASGAAGGAGETGNVPPDAPEAAPEETLLHLPPGELVRFGLIDNRGLFVVAAAFGALAQSGFLDPNRNDRDDGPGGPSLPRVPSGLLDLLGDGVVALPVLIIGAFVALVIALRGLSIAVALVTLHDFRLTRRGDDLRTRYGLLTEVSATLRRRRIQAVHQTATLLHRVFDRVSLRVDLAGGNSAQSAEQNGRGARRDSWLAPLAPGDGAGALIGEALPGADVTAIAWRPLPPKARGRHFRRLCAFWIPALAIPTAIFAADPLWIPAAVAAPVPVLWLHAAMTWRHTAWALNDTFFLLRRGWLTRRLSIMPRNRVQSVHVTVSPFDRRHRMARIDIDHAGAGPLSHRLHLAYLMDVDARAIQADLTVG